jgi:oxepin-CoA hydrolase / 3-oxo-5,6-dehydrosuberyl-CoA semialdehyde dehydrogenase
MKTLKLLNYAQDQWYGAETSLAPVENAVTGEVIAETGSGGLDFEAMLDHAREVGGPALRRMTFHERAWMLKDLANAIMARKEELYELNYATGATRADGWIDIEGGAGTLFSFSSKGRRELPNGRVLIDGPMEMLSKEGSFVGQHVFTPLQGVAVHINAFNFPVWGMLEKLGPTLLAGVPAIVKPASSTGYLAEVAFRIMIEANVLPPGALQLIMGGVGDLFDHLTLQDVVSFTGSANTAMKLQAHPVIARESVRFIAERDSLNASVLGPDAAPGTPEFDLFVREVAREMTVKAGQKCTAIRRAMAPAGHIDAVEAALKARLARVKVGDPREEGVTMGALASRAQLDGVRWAVGELAKSARIVAGDPEATPVPGNGAFMSPVLLRADDPWNMAAVHDIEAFGPVSTIMPYKDLGDAVALANRGMGSLALSLFTFDPAAAEAFVLGAGAYHGRMVILDRTSAKESTGHGSPLPVLVHGGPGRAGGGEELGGIRGVLHHMQRTAVQASPDMITAITGQWTTGATRTETDVHPFRKSLADLAIGDTIRSQSRTISHADIEHFAEFTGDTFYAHTDEEAAAKNPLFGGIVAHGYLVVSIAAGLFVEPSPGPVLANFGVDNLRFLTPVKAGDEIAVTLTVKQVTPRATADYGEVRWDAVVTNGDGDPVATYDVLTLVAKTWQGS